MERLPMTAALKVRWSAIMVKPRDPVSSRFLLFFTMDPLRVHGFFLEKTKIKRKEETP